MIMNKWLQFSGIVLIVIGLFFLSPLADMLPIDMWGAVNRFLRGGERPTYFRVVPTEQSFLLPWFLIGMGLTALIFSWLLANRRPQ